MNYITSCPACETQFLLSTEHLKAYRGKVQCGHCEHIFNAKNRLTEVSDDIQSSTENDTKLETSKPITSSIFEDKPITDALDGELGTVPNLEDLNFNSTLYADANDTYIDEQIRINIEDNYSYENESPVAIEDLSTDSKFRPKKTRLYLWLLLLSLILIVLAAIQTVYFLRIKIAAEYPQFKPYLVHVCSYLQCSIDLPKNLDLFTIDDSDMQESEDYVKVVDFSSLLINKANYTQAYPNIELTLTNTDDRPVVRRLIKPSEYLNASTNLVAGITSKEEMRVKLAINVADLSVAGYRVLLAY